MIKITGDYTSAIIYTSNNKDTAIDEYATAQIQMLCNNEAMKDCRIRIMPDVHPGMVGTIGFTTTIGEKLLPNLIGVDIGCGMTLAQLKQKKIEFQRLDTVIRDNIPSGFAIHQKLHHFAKDLDFSALYCYKQIREKKAMLSLGTLGGGNHFIEVDKDDQGILYVVIHSGSRHLGKEVTEYYLKEGQKQLKEQGISIPYPLTYLEGNLKKQYLHDLSIVQTFAEQNRQTILNELAKGMKWKITASYSCVHNYVDTIHSEAILRKGAICAKLGEKVIIPINMRDGIILGSGLSNADWNYSAPHGAGRILKREDVKSKVTLSAFKAEMKGIYSSCINRETLDEAPQAYRKLDDLAEAIKDTVQIDNIIRPVYNFKAGAK